MGRCSCQGQSEEKCSTSILYQLLNRGCQCGAAQERTLLSPWAASKAASEVLLKTVEFVKKLPSFLALPPQDCAKLLQEGWAPLFLLGLAQEKLDFHLASPKKSILLGILTEKQQQQGDSGGQYREKLGKAKEFLNQCWSLDISTKEYVYLKGIVLFSPGEPPGRQATFYFFFYIFVSFFMNIIGHVLKLSCIECTVLFLSGENLS